MNLPKNISEDEFVDIVDNISKRLCNKFRFGYYTRDDIYQECFIEAIKGLERYDDKRPLSNFLYTHIKNRLCNLKRDKYFRLEKPCDKCPIKAYCPKDDSCSAYQDKTDCELYSLWIKKNNNKKNIMNPIGISYVNDENERNMKSSSAIHSKVAQKEIIDILDQGMSLHMRKYWIQQKAGIKISKKQYDMLLEEIHSILEENNIDASQTW